MSELVRETAGGVSLRQRLSSGAAWSLAGAVGSRALVLAGAVLAARLLGKDRYGELGLIQSTLGMFGVLSGFGLGSTATKYVAELRRTDPARAARIMRLARGVSLVGGALVALLVLGLAPTIAARALSAPHLVQVVRIAALGLLFGSLGGAAQGALSGLEAFRALAAINLASAALGLPLTVVGTWLGGVMGGTWALVGTSAITWVGCERALARELRAAKLPATTGGLRQELSVLWHFSLPALLASLLATPVNWLAAALLVSRPGGFSEMGVWNAANQWFSAVLFLPGVAGQVVLPVLAERMGAADTRHLHRLLILHVGVNAVLVLPVIATTALASDCLMALFGRQFTGGEGTLVVAVTTAGLLAVQSPVGSLITASGRMWVGLLMNLGWAIAFVGATLWLVHRGAMGVALARLAAYGLHFVWTSVYALAILRRWKLERAR